jgi:prolipoprotein diacylglyceryl transferase
LNALLYIRWDFGPEIFTIPGIDWPLRWYGLLFAAAFVFSNIIMARVYKAEGRPATDLDKLTLYIIGGTVIGARLGHCLFYSPAYYLQNPIEILQIWKGGLASHGGAIGIIAGMVFYCRKTKEDWRWIFDRIVIVAALSSMFIRGGNLMNSEIIGKPANGTTAFLFTFPLKEAIEQNGEIEFDNVQFEESGKDTIINGISHPIMNAVLGLSFTGNQSTLFITYDLIAGIIRSQPERENHFILLPGIKPEISEDGRKIRIALAGVPRHPTQVYEGLFYLLLFVMFYFMWSKYRKRLPKGVMFGLFAMLMFEFRFLIEFLKERQELWEERQMLDMGQWLSVPFILFGLGMIIYGYKKKEYHLVKEPPKPD